MVEVIFLNVADENNLLRDNIIDLLPLNKDDRENRYQPM